MNQSQVDWTWIDNKLIVHNLLIINYLNLIKKLMQNKLLTSVFRIAV